MRNQNDKQLKEEKLQQGTLIITPMTKPKN